MNDKGRLVSRAASTDLIMPVEAAYIVSMVSGFLAALLPGNT